MISSTFIQGLMAGKLQGDLFAGAGNVKQGAGKQPGFSNLLRGLMNRAGVAEEKVVSGFSQLKGHSFLEQFKKAIMASGKSLEDYEINADALTEFGSLLVRAGFRREDVEQMLSDMKTGAGEKKITLATLFNRASQLPKPEEGADAQVFLDISTLPFLETILGKLGLAPETVRSVLADAKVEGAGIDVKRLAGNLRRTMAGDEESVDESVATLEGAEDVAALMQQIGLLEGGDETFTSLLDKMIGDLTRFKAAQTDITGRDGGEGIPEELLALYLQQSATTPGDHGDALQQLIASARNENGDLNADALLSRLVQMRQNQTAAAAASIPDTRGEMTLPRFVSALESRVATEQNLSGATVASSSDRSMTEMVRGFMAEISPTADAREGKHHLTPGIGGGKRDFALGTGADDKRAMIQNPQQTLDKSVAGATTKEDAVQNLVAASREASPGNSDAGRNPSEHSAGREESAKMMDTFTRGGNRTKQTADQNLINADGFLKELKSGEETVSFTKTTSNRTLPGYLLDQVSRQIVKLRASGENEITLQLKPPHLGRLKLNVEHTTAGLKVGIVAESAASKEMLLANVNDLKAALSDQGLRLDRIDVEAQADFGKSMAQTGHEFGQTGGRKSKWAGSKRGGAEGLPEDSAVPERAREEGAGRLDLVA